MNKQLIVDYLPFEIEPEQINESMKENDGKLIVRGVLQRAESKNQNGRVYPKDILVREAKKYTDEFINPTKVVDGIRLASIEEIIAMKLEVIQNEGRKKDFWDIHELLSSYRIDDMLKLHEKRYPYGHNRELLLDNFTNFERADDDFDPICLKGKIWAFIKEDIQGHIDKFRQAR